MGPPISAVAPLHTGPPSSDKQLHLSLAQHGDGDGTKSFDDKGDRALISDVRPTTPKSLASRGTGGTGDARVSSKGMFYPHTERICDIRGETFDSEATAMFIDPEKMKEGVRKALLRPAYDVRDFYHKQGLWQHIARNHVFEHITLAVIGVNALWMMIDTDNNSAPTLLEAEPIFQIAEHSFCFYFSFEWFVRFMAFEHKRDGMKDAWFVFDSMLVFMMVLETWLMTIIIAATGAGSSGGMGNTGILRLFRLLRLSRMARMLRSMPELMILIKGMVAATRSVFFTLCLLLIIMYVFAIAFTQLCADSEVGELYFSTILGSMYTLLIVGTFFDNLGDVVTDVGRASYIYAALFMLFIALAALMVMNMLIGVLCEVVSAVATTEKEGMLVSFVRSKMLEVVKALDVDGDMMISKAEFVQIMENHDAVSALQEVDVDPVGLVDMVDFIFEKENEDDEDEENSLSFCDFMDVILELRGNNTATVKDVVDLQKFMTQGIKRFEDRLSRRSSLTSSRSSWKSTPPAQQSSEEQAQSSPPDQRTGRR